MDSVQQIYRREINALGCTGRVLRTGSLFESGWKIVEARALRQNPDLEGKALRLAMARIMYRRHPQIQKLLDDYESANL